MESVLLRVPGQRLLSRLRVTLMAGLLLLPAGCASSFIYYPERLIRATPAAVNLSYESVSIITKDGVRLSGWWVPAKEARGVVLFFHGNGGNISYYLDTLPVFNRLGLTTFIIDYRGYGISEGHPSEEGTYLDAEAAWDYLVSQRKVPPNRIIIMGRSLGGAIAAWLASRHTPAITILESSFLSFARAAKDLYPWAPAKMLFGNMYATEEYARQIRSPVLVIHSPDDELIAFHHGLRLFELASAPKELLKISGSHNSGFYQSLDTYEPGIGGFISRHLPSTFVPPIVP